MRLRAPATASHKQRVPGKYCGRGPLLAAQEADVAICVPAGRGACRVMAGTGQVHALHMHRRGMHHEQGCAPSLQNNGKLLAELSMLPAYWRSQVQLAATRRRSWTGLYMSSSRGQHARTPACRSQGKQATVPKSASGNMPGHPHAGHKVEWPEDTKQPGAARPGVSMQVTAMSPMSKRSPSFTSRVAPCTWSLTPPAMRQRSHAPQSVPGGHTWGCMLQLNLPSRLAS